jgi:ABC-type sugar transport system ATPase subunit
MAFVMNVHGSDSYRPSSAFLLEMRGVTKSFPGVRALQGVDLELRAGEVLALVGENGAGKSTLIKVLGGAHQPDAGTIRINGNDAAIASPQDATRSGIAVIYQEFNLVPSLSAYENIFLGQEVAPWGFVQQARERRLATELFQRIGVPIDPLARCKDLTVAQQQVVEIAKALALHARIIVMDEPSATLTPREVEHLFDVIKELVSHGIGIIYISHRLEEVFSIANRVMVMRDGQHVGTYPTTEVTRKQLIERMVGRSLEDEFPLREPKLGPVHLEVRDLADGQRVTGVSFSVRRGEILGITGLVGAGRTEMARMIAGVDRARQGDIFLDGRLLRVHSPRDAIAAGICLLSEDRKAEGLIPRHFVIDNFGLPNLQQFSHRGWINQQAERSALARYVASLKIKLSHPWQLAGHLSGGNQQKVVLAKWLQRNCDVIIFDEPTRGIDVGAKFEIYVLMNELAATGKSILMISSELPEVLGMSDRILVMHEGRIRGEIRDVANATQEDVMNLAIGNPVRHMS